MGVATQFEVSMLSEGGTVEEGGTEVRNLHTRGYRGNCPI